MKAVEVLCVTVMMILGILTSESDRKTGHIYNKDLFIFLCIAVLLDNVYYGYFARDLILPFLLNVGMILLISLFLFYSHSFAGGDCKLTVVMALLYPANYYITYGRSVITLFFSLGLAVFYGYVYLLGLAVRNLVRKRNRMTKAYVKNYLLSFLKSFLAASAYIGMLNVLLVFLNRKGIVLNAWLIRVVCVGTAWLVGKIRKLQQWYVVVGLITLDLVIGIPVGVLPFSLNPENYILVIGLLLCQMTIKTSLYEEISVADLKKGMILSAVSSMLMQGSRIRGLPGISTEDLKSRLSEAEVSSIRRWAESREVTSVSIVKKIPFAIFIFLGFLSYLGIWGVV